MFGTNNKATNPNQVPSYVYEILQENPPRRRLWFLQIIAGAVIVIALTTLVVWLTHVTHSNNSSVRNSRVTQSPQSNNVTNKTIPPPVTTPAGNSNNSKSVLQPSN